MLNSFYKICFCSWICAFIVTRLMETLQPDWLPPLPSDQLQCKHAADVWLVLVPLLSDSRPVCPHLFLIELQEFTLAPLQGDEEPLEWGGGIWNNGFSEWSGGRHCDWLLWFPTVTLLFTCQHIFLFFSFYWIVQSVRKTCCVTSRSQRWRVCTCNQLCVTGRCSAC